MRCNFRVQRGANKKNYEKEKEEKMRKTKKKEIMEKYV
jgi:hypothetical protein